MTIFGWMYHLTRGSPKAWKSCCLCSQVFFVSSDVFVNFIFSIFAGVLRRCGFRRYQKRKSLKRDLSIFRIVYKAGLFCLMKNKPM